MRRSLRHTPTAVFLSVPLGLFAALGVLGLFTGIDVESVVRAVVYTVPLVVVWSLRVRLVSGGVELVRPRRVPDDRGTRRVSTSERIAATTVRAVRVGYWFPRGWTTQLELTDGDRRRLVALTALKLAPGSAGERVAPGLVQRAQVLADHLGVPLVQGGDPPPPRGGRQPHPTVPPPPGPPPPGPPPPGPPPRS